jgi:hypothetical protein
MLSPVELSLMQVSKLPTRTSNVQVLILPEELVAVHVTVVVPTGNAEPEAGLQVTVTVPPQGSLATGVGNVTTAEVPLVEATTVEGHVIVGVSNTTTANEHGVPVLGVAVIVVTPTGNKSPD